jgi:PAS domain S-box-containing protein
VWRTIIQRQEKVRRLEVAHRKRNGQTFPVEMSAVPLQTAQGVRILCSARDISERRRAEDQMANFFRLSEDMMCIADAQGNFRQMSPAFEQVLGYKLEEMLGRPYLDFVHPDDVDMTREEGRKVFEGRGAVNFENRYRCKDGTYKWLQWRPFREVYEGMIYAIARDVTESHRNSRLMRQTSMAAKIGGWEYDFVTGEVFWTDETYRLHDLSPQEFRPTRDNVMDFYTPASQALFLQTTERALADGKPWSLELEMITAEGRHIWVHVLGRIDIEHGQPVRTYGSFQDITERKAEEEERRKIDDQLREMQRIESIGILAGGIAHDFNNLLTGVLGFTRLAAAEAEATGSETMRSHLQQIEQCSLRAADLCKQLLAYAGKGQFALETIDLSDLVRETSALIESIVGSNAKLELELDDQLPLLEGDPTQLRQVVMNLVTNAFDALGQKEGTVRVCTGVRHFSTATLQSARVRGDIAAGEHVFLEVSDEGAGMSEKTVARIFDPFFTTKFAGRGLGLAAVQGIVRTHQGAILVTSTLGQGTTFTVVLPSAEDPERDPHSSSRIAAQTAPETTRAASGGTVLLVDDEAAVLSLARTALERGGFKTLTAQNGPEALELFRKDRPEIVAVIVDMTMPGMNGLEVLRALRAEDPRLPLLPMSGYTEKSLDAATAELDLSGFVEKPFRLGDLVTAVQTALDARR